MSDLAGNKISAFIQLMEKGEDDAVDRLEKAANEHGGHFSSNAVFITAGGTKPGMAAVWRIFGKGLCVEWKKGRESVEVH